VVRGMIAKSITEAARFIGESWHCRGKAPPSWVDSLASRIALRRGGTQEDRAQALPTRCDRRELDVNYVSWTIVKTSPGTFAILRMERD